MYWGKEQVRLAESETELPSRGTDLHPSKIPLPSRNFSDVIPGTLAQSHSPAHVSTRLFVIIYSMCIYDMSFLFSNECFICVGPIFPLDHQRPLKVGFLLFLSLCLMTTCRGFQRQPRVLPQSFRDAECALHTLLPCSSPCCEWPLIRPSLLSRCPIQRDEWVFEKVVATELQPEPGCPHQAPCFP